MKNKGRGRPKGSTIIKATPEVLLNVERMAGVGSTHEEIADFYGVSKVCWNNTKKRYPAIETCYRKGRGQTKFFVKGKLYQQIKAGNLTAIIFYLKTQCGWSEKNSLEVETKVKSKHHNYTIDTMDAIEASKIYQSIMTGSYNDERNRSSK